MKKYIISAFTGFDSDENLYYTKVGIESKNTMPLLYTVWGITKEASRIRAELLVGILSKKNITT